MKTKAAHSDPRRTTASVFINLTLGLFSLSCIFPIIWLIYSSLKETNAFMHDIIGLPNPLFFDNYKTLFQSPQLPMFFWNSIRNTVMSLVFILLFGFVVGYFLSRYKFKGNRAIYMLFMAGMLMPVHALIVPMYIQFLQTGLHDQWFTLLFPYVCFGLPIAVFLVESYLRGIPSELEAAASIDGASFSRTLFQIIMPVVSPVLTTIGIIQFFNCWNEFIFALILTNSERFFTLPLGVNLMKGQFTTNYTKIMAIMVLAICPALFVYFLFSKRIIEGMVAGAVKG